MSDMKKKTMTDEEKAARRAEIMANLAKAKAEKEKVEAQKHCPTTDVPDGMSKNATST